MRRPTTESSVMSTASRSMVVLHYAVANGYTDTIDIFLSKVPAPINTVDELAYPSMCLCALW